VGYDYGIETLLEVQYQDGSAAAIRANGGLVVAAGAAFLPLAGGAFETRATVGVKYAPVAGRNGSARYLAFPVEVMEAWNVHPLRLALGASLSLGPTLRGEGVLGGLDVDLKQSLGLICQAEWVFPLEKGLLSAGARLLWQRLEATGGGAAMNATAVGILLGFTL
jgi:hypothetical protein